MGGWLVRYVDGCVRGVGDRGMESEVDGQAGRRMDANHAGFDTKIMRNCGTVHLKGTKIDRLMNKLVIMVSFTEPLLWGEG